MSWLGRAWGFIYHFLVDSPWLAAAALVALVLAAALASAGPGGAAAAGWLLFALLVVAVGVDVRREAARRSGRTRSPAPAAKEDTPPTA